MEYKTSDQLYEEGPKDGKYSIKLAFYEQLLPEDATEEQKKFFQKMVQKLSLKGMYEERLINYFRKREPRRFYDDLWGLKVVHFQLETEYHKEVSKYETHDWVFEGNFQNTLWCVEFFKGEMKLKGVEWKKGEPVPKNIQRCFHMIDHTLKRKPTKEHPLHEHNIEKLLKDREKLVKRYGEP